MTNPVSKHEAIQPPAQFIRHHKDDRQCPLCGGRMVRRSRKCIECKTRRPDVTHPADPTKRHIALTQGKVAVVDASEYERVNSLLWCAWRTMVHGEYRYYAVRANLVDGKWVSTSMHRFIMGVTDPKIEVDHKSPKDTLNNCRDNLRLSTPGQNQANRLYYPNLSGYKGVAIAHPRQGRNHADRWRGEIVVGGKRLVSKLFLDPEPAARWYDAMAVIHYGEFARINFPEAEGHRSYPPEHPPAETAC